MNSAWINFLGKQRTRARVYAPKRRGQISKYRNFLVSFIRKKSNSLTRVTIMAPTQSNSVTLGFVAILCDIVYLLTALVVADAIAQIAFSSAPESIPPALNLLVVGCAIIWAYAMGLYRLERLVAREMIVPLLVAFTLVTLCAIVIMSLAGFRETLQGRWLSALPLAFTMMFIGRLAAASIFHLDEAAAVRAKENRQVRLEALRANNLGSAFCNERSLFSNTVKRCMDIVLCTLLLAFTLPVTLLAALAILIEDGRPIFYRQERVGRNGKPFLLYKFRSMYVSAEADGIARWAQVHDCRVTMVGKFLRRSRIDEFPQFINVLLGDMSLVGPRPERPTIAAMLESEIQNYRYRYRVKPGITGWAQVNYPYGASLQDAQEKTKYDFFYLEHGSIILDTRILLQTVRVILMGEGAR
ncbi:lipopolysaccharide/colanic/teichoic acid biosynthesis glycosyltransferase [Pararhizobium capsulatum DSM 1112]|uniref:Lipopolysaccharide/colanic/teichoic acid biosynthesis glycosyltransferase n=1 Tax=Pararhizobium capsulatum DSM 1112 TaxID=1121113 RepID=A0ABU0BS77_9HYPH|nr:exopolysaccharide biosynthesis polyprenyl glycosylphosphotransferase [Pararhizobium capsulatum]MDQ0321094.1 lipopolysaccharide/colanic/teichoic acid biosynthesis glycosyltransferase [Pararhizobium capsulatum DSM 1112]